MQNILACMKVCHILAERTKPKDMDNKKLQTVLACQICCGDKLATTGAKIHLVEVYGTVTRIHAHRGTMDAKNCEVHVFANAQGVEVIR